jgi:hypothetical protein
VRAVLLCSGASATAAMRARKQWLTEMDAKPGLSTDVDIDEADIDRRTDVHTRDVCNCCLALLHEWIAVRSDGECDARGSQLDCRQQSWPLKTPALHLRLD